MNNGRNSPVAGKRTRRLQLANRILVATNDLEEIVDFMTKLVRGIPVPTDPVRAAQGLPTEEQIPTLDQRQRAAEWLTQYSVGRPTEFVELEVETKDAEFDPRRLDTPALEALVRTLDAARTTH